MTRLHWIVASLALSVASPAVAACGSEDTALFDTASRREDCDSDGWTKGQGDCDDENDAVNPGESEVCEDKLDNDCNGLFDDGCDDASRRGTLLGGSACGNSNSGFLWFFLPLSLIRRRGPR